MEIGTTPHHDKMAPFFSGFHIPKIIKIVKFLTVIPKTKRCYFWDCRVHCRSINRTV